MKFISFEKSRFNHFGLFYFGFTFIIVFFILFHVFNRWEMFDFLGDFISVEKSFSSQKRVVFIEGQDAYFSYDGISYKKISPGLSIKNDIIIQTNSGSIIFFIENNGYYHVHPDSTLHIEYLDNYNFVPFERASQISLFKGKLSIETEFLSYKSRLSVRTPELICSVNKGKFIIERDIDKEITRLNTLKDIVQYRPMITNSQTRDNPEQIPDYISTFHRELKTGEKISLSQQDLMTLRKMLFHSEEVDSQKFDFIDNLSNVQEAGEQTGEFSYFHFDKNNFENNCSLILNIEHNSNLYFDDFLLDNNFYMLYLKRESYTIIEKLPFTGVFYRLNLMEDKIKSLSFATHRGLRSIYINDKKINYIVSAFNEEISLDTSSYQIIKPAMPKYSEDSYLLIETDLPLAGLYLVSYDSSLKIAGFTGVLDSFFIDGSKVYIYKKKSSFSNISSQLLYLGKENYLSGEKVLYLFLEYRPYYSISL